MKNESTYKITIEREYVYSKDSMDFVKRVIKNHDGEVIYSSYHEMGSMSDKSDPVATLEKSIGLHWENEKSNNPLNLDLGLIDSYDYRKKLMDKILSACKKDTETEG